MDAADLVPGEYNEPAQHSEACSPLSKLIISTYKCHVTQDQKDG